MSRPHCRAQIAENQILLAVQIKVLDHQSRSLQDRGGSGLQGQVKRILKRPVFTKPLDARGTFSVPNSRLHLDYMRDGDVLVVPSMDRLARNMRDLQNLVADLNSRNIAVEFVKENLSFIGDTENPI
jgi:hypothetical protein